MADEGLTSFADMYKYIQPETAEGDAFAAPGVDTHIVYGYNVTTICGLMYDVDFKKDPSSIPPAPISTRVDCNPDGDGTVNINSLMRAELTWKDDPRQRGFALNATGFVNMEHMDAVKDSRVLDYIANLIKD